MKSVVCLGDCLIFAKCKYYLLCSLVACMSDSYTYSYLLIKANYKTMKSVVCFGDCLIFAKCICIVFSVHWLLGFQTPTLTVANKPHIYYLKQIVRQWIVWSALVTASYLLSVLSSVFNN